MQRLDLAAIVRQSAADHKAQFEQKDITLDVQTPASPVWVEGDAVRLTQVVGNLFNNAIKFTDPTGRVTSRVAIDAGQVMLEVSDTGIGMTPKTIGTLFEPFAQAEESLKRSSGGLGLGLAVVKGLIELHDGLITATSAGAGQGSTFTLRLPACRGPRPQSAPADDRIANNGSIASARGRRQSRCSARGQ